MSDLIEIVSTPPAPPATEPIFSIDGVVYEAPVEYSAWHALQLMHRLRHDGLMETSAWMLEEALGADAYAALLACRSVSPDQLQAISEAIRARMLGSADPKASPSVRPKRSGSSPTSATSKRTSSPGTGSTSPKRTSRARASSASPTA